MNSENRYDERFLGVTPKSQLAFEDKHHKTLRLFSNNQFDRILDIGCGDGNFSKNIKEACKAKEIYGIELSTNGVEIAKENGVIAIHADIEIDFPFQSNYFDAVYAGEIIEHVYDTDHVLEEIFRVLRAGGILVITTPNLASIHNRIALLMGFLPLPLAVSTKYNVGHIYKGKNQRFPQSADHLRVFTLRSLIELLTIHKFEILKVQGSSAILPKNMRFLNIITLVEKFINIFPSLSYRLIILCQKSV